MAQQMWFRVRYALLGVNFSNVMFLGAFYPKNPKVRGRNRVFHANENVEYLKNGKRFKRDSKFYPH
jgi:hypothetical protein